ncbi:hypothetical protein WH50_24990 [Pokkaliibacter plantistimulans]|uniref:CSD domain-containing protein n=1 Tax=Pokkaliibacter plantistimulans TaxID=1635171 RepID=A0ABX5LR53_9GAMM|nr:retron Se72 family effector protein [Pokkaliibacter plantistimulans]PXF28682.1 hypothetical protein WH50_24990 [Pokkaliibacter plantistimulans]
MSEQFEYGTVRVFDTFKGFGFIRRSVGKDVFFFYTEINNEEKVLVEGDRVQFIVRPQQKGPRAYEISKVS